MYIPHYVSCVMCHVSCVTCHVSRVTCHMSKYIFFSLHFFFFLSLKQIKQSGGASRWRVCYQRGLPRLVFFIIQRCTLSARAVDYSERGGRKGRVDTTGRELEKERGRDIKLLIVKFCHPSALLLRRNLVFTF